MIRKNLKVDNSNSYWMTRAIDRFSHVGVISRVYLQMHNMHEEKTDDTRKGANKVLIIAARYSFQEATEGSVEYRA